MNIVIIGTGHSLIIYREELDLTLSILPCRQGRIDNEENGRTPPKLGRSTPLGIWDGFPNTYLILIQHGYNFYILGFPGSGLVTRAR